VACVKTSAPERPRGWRGWHYRLYDWVLRWAAHRRAQSALFLLAFAEASFFPIPPDVLLIAMAVARTRRALRYALVATLGSVTGGMLGYWIGRGLWNLVDDHFFRYLGAFGFTPENFGSVQSAYQANAFLAIFTAGFTPIPYKVFTIAAGVFEVNLAVFLAASVLGRAGRFFLVALLIRWLGPRVLPFIERYLGWLSLAFIVLLVLGFYLIKVVGSH
jgi:membrane protein YqaA with SNARE-associated domain